MAAAKHLIDAYGRAVGHMSVASRYGGYGTTPETVQRTYGALLDAIMASLDGPVIGPSDRAAIRRVLASEIVLALGRGDVEPTTVGAILDPADLDALERLGGWGE